ncbi:MAG: hypothetical protein ACFFCZ_17575 [Promethearchaeota archaeon]
MVCIRGYSDSYIAPYQGTLGGRMPVGWASIEQVDIRKSDSRVLGK